MTVKENDWNETEDDDSVGYQRPPRHTRFKRGQSGNPGGRAKHKDDPADLLKRALAELVVVKRQGGQVRASKLDIIVTQLINGALRGDYKFIRELFRFTGVKRKLSESLSTHAGLSEETAEMIRAALGGLSLEEFEAQRRSETDESASTHGVLRNVQSDQKSDYLVGHGRPPLHSRFQPGRSGNPAGRPPGPRGFKSLALKQLGEHIEVSENGRRRTCTKLEAILVQIVNRAAKGDLHFQSLLWDLAPGLNLERGRKRALSKKARFARISKMMNKGF